MRVDRAGTTTTEDLSYFSRLADAETFGRLATGETHRRGTATAGTVVAVADGAGWCQGFVDMHRPDAVRILDVPHAVGHLGQVAQALFGLGTAAASTWLADQASALRHGGEAAVLTELTARATASGGHPATRQLLTQTHADLATRRTQIRYAAFGEASSPIGSGCIESANKLIVEARLKGAGMHWARSNVNPMLALRTVDANARWAEAWPAMWNHLCHPPRPVGSRPAPARATTDASRAGLHAADPTYQDHRQRQTHRRPPLEPLRSLSCKTMRRTLLMWPIREQSLRHIPE